MIKLTDKSSVEAVVREMTLEEKATLLCGGSSYGSAAIERLGIPAALFIDAGGGVNLRQYLADLRSRGLMRPDNEKYIGSQLVYILDRIDRQDELSENEKRLLSVFLDYLRENFVPSGELPSCFPVNSLLASTWDPEIVLSVARQVGKEASAFGVDMLLGTPCINIQRDPRGGRCFEFYSEDPYLTAAMAQNYPKGVQEAGVCADVKHFAVNNQETDRRTVDARVSERALREIYLPGFRACVQEGGAKNVMTSYNKINGVSASQNKWLLQDVLRKEWGFDGFVVSDWGGVYDWNAALEAGNDIRMPPVKPENNRLAEAVRNGELEEAVLDRAVTNYLNVLVDMPVMRGRKYTDIDSEAAKKVAYRAAAEGIVLLKNDAGTLPLCKSANVSFYGEKCRRFQESGVGSGHVHTNKTGSLLGASASLIGKEHTAFETVSAKTDAVIVTVWQNGQEGTDQPNMQLPAGEAALLERAIGDAQSVGAKVIVVLNTAAPVELSAYIDRIDALLLVYFPGQEGSRAAADILFGECNPSGKLAQTYPAHEYDLPAFGNFPGENETVMHGEGIFVGYRWYDARHIEPLFPFGHGLSYTSFELSEPKLSSDTFRYDEEPSVTASVRIRNTGKRAGAEVVQLYLRDVRSTQLKPVKELKDFMKVRLEAGEEREVTFALTPEKFTSFDEALGAWVCEPGMFEVLIGTSSRDVRLSVPLRVTGKNPYGYGKNTSYAAILKDARAVEVIRSFLPEDTLTDGDIRRQTAYITFVLKWERAFYERLAPKLTGYTGQELDALFEKITDALAAIDITDQSIRYEEMYVY